MVMQSACRMVHGRCSVSAAQAASSALTCGECGVRFLSRDLDPGAFAFDNLYPTVGGYRSINYRNCGCGACRSLTRGVQSAAARGVRWVCRSVLSAPYTTGSRQRGAVGVLVTSVAVLHETASAAHLARGLRAAAASVWCCYRDDSESEGGRCHGCRSALNSTPERTGLQPKLMLY